MKKILFMLTAAMLSLTACQQIESFDFLVGETNIGVDFDYTHANFDNANVKAQFEQIFAAKHQAWEREFIAEVNDEIENVLMTAYTAENAPASVNYTFMVEITEITEYGITKADVKVYNKLGVQEGYFTIKAYKDFDHGFIARILDTMEDLGERLGEQIRYGM